MSEVQDHNWMVEVWGRNARWLDRLHRAGMVYDPHQQKWFRGGLSENQARSLVGRMRQADLKVLLHGKNAKIENTLRRAHWAPHQPNAHEREMIRREEAARRKVSRSLAKHDPKYRHPKDNARKTHELRSMAPGSKSSP